MHTRRIRVKLELLIYMPCSEFMNGYTTSQRVRMTARQLEFAIWEVSNGSLYIALRKDFLEDCFTWLMEFRHSYLPYAGQIIIVNTTWLWLQGRFTKPYKESASTQLGELRWPCNKMHQALMHLLCSQCLLWPFMYCQYFLYNIQALHAVPCFTTAHVYESLSWVPRGST